MITYAYKVQRCNVDGSGCADIVSSDQGYVPVLADVGKRLKPVITATNAIGSTEAPGALSQIVLPAGAGGGGGPLVPSGAYQWFDGESFPPPPSPWIYTNAAAFFSTLGVHASKVPDPFGGGEGNVILLENDYDSTIPTDYGNPPPPRLQQQAIFLNPPYAHAGYNGKETTFYVCRFGFSTDSYFQNGDGPGVIAEWHFSTGGAGPQSSVLQTYAGWPLTSGGSLTAHLIMRISILNPDGTTSFRYFPGDVATPDLCVAAGAPVLTKGAWHTAEWEWTWATDPTVGRMVYILDGVELGNFSGQTQSVGDYYSFGAYNYRYNITNPTKMYLAALGLGPTATSIGVA